MPSRIDAFIQSLDDQVDDIAARCTACGKCAAVCPTLSVAGLDHSDPQELTAGVRDLLRGDTAPDASKSWAEACCGSGACQHVCEHGINPRFMLTMAKRAINQAHAIAPRRKAGKAGFQKMSRGVRVLSRLSLPPDLLEKLSPRSHPESETTPDLVFYTGCNMLKTPHIGLLCLDVLDRLDVTYEVHGGPSACCGIYQMRPGDLENSARQAFNTLDKLAASKTAQVLSWCPTCQVQFGETMIPNYQNVTGTALDMTMFPVYLAQRLDDLRPHLTKPVPKRVAIYEYAGELGVMAAVQKLLGAVPGLEIVELRTSSIGFVSTALAPLGDYYPNTVATILREAEACNVDVLVNVYHPDHRELSAHESEWPFAVANYMELVGESMGLTREDHFKQLKLMRDADAIVAASRELIDAHGFDPAHAREIVVSEMLDDQHLPVDRRQHPST